jgi:single-stranded-DNA-specific exonuclease
MLKSRTNKIWQINKEAPSQSLVDFCPNILVAKVLTAREVKTREEAHYYIGSNRPAFSSPFEIPELEKAIERIEKAISKNQNIVIYGDYDVDGTTSTALLTNALRILGANVSYYIPNRFSEGYGLNSKAIVQIKSQRRADLLISCDCGITNFEEVKLAQSIGLDVIVTDHHSLPEKLPPAVAVLNPKLLPAVHPLHWLPGVGVVYKLSEALLERASKNSEIEKLLDFVALGMIADMAPLRAENRLLVQDGLKILAHTERPGLQALLAECGYRSDEEGVGFAIAPRINAAGRLNDANEAVKLFLSEDFGEASLLARELSNQNSSRQSLCDETLKQAIERVEAEFDLNKSKAIMLADKRWHHGVVGIVASRLVEKYNLPVFLAVEDDESVKGSARGIPAIDLFEEISKHSQFLSKFGGHKAAAGFSLVKSKWLDFQTALSGELKTVLNSTDLQPTLAIDSTLTEGEVSIKSLDSLWSLAPFGIGFQKPIFTFAEDAIVKDVVSLGRGQEHTKILIQNGSETFEAIQWRSNASDFAEAKRQGKIKIAFTPNKREYNGRTYLQLEIKDWQLTEKEQIVVQKDNIPKLSESNSEIEFFDHRKESQVNNKTLQNLLDKKNVYVFAEGKSIEKAKELFSNYKIIDRNDSPTECQTLILWSLPINQAIRHKLTQNKNLREIWVFGNNLQVEQNTKTFLRDLMILLKSHNEKTFHLSLNELESSLEALNKTCLEGLKILAESGLLSFILEGNEVKIELLGSPSKLQLNTQNLQQLLLDEQKQKQKLLIEPIHKLII